MINTTAENELRLERLNNRLLIFENFENLGIKISLTIIGVILIFCLRDNFSQLIFIVAISALISFTVKFLFDLLKSFYKKPIFDFNKSTQTIYYWGDKISFDKIKLLTLELEINHSDDSTEDWYRLNLETKENDVLNIFQSRNNRELVETGQIISEFLGLQFLKLSEEESKQRKADRRFKRLVNQFKNKFKSKSITELQEIMDRKELMEDYTIEAVKKLLEIKK